MEEGKAARTRVQGRVGKLCSEQRGCALTALLGVQLLYHCPNYFADS